MKIYLLEDPDPEYPFLSEVYLPGHDCEFVPVDKTNSVQATASLADREPGVVFNLCDGAADEERPGVEVIHVLERLNLPFTGAHADFYSATRRQMKAACQACGVPVPVGVSVPDLESLPRRTRTLRYPLLVKHPNSYASVGLCHASRVDDLAGLEKQVERMLAAYGGALVEEFIEGREFSVLVVEDPDHPSAPKVYQPLEFLFPPGESFKHEELKWVTYEKMTTVPVADPELARRLQDLSVRMFLGMDGSGFGRCDLRGDAHGNLFMLEINPNCGVFYPPDAPGTADHILHLDGGHAGFVDLLLRGALARQRRRALL